MRRPRTNSSDLESIRTFFSFVKDAFVKLTTRLYPHGTEHEVVPILRSLMPDHKFEEKSGNWRVVVPGDDATMFTAHLDTALEIHGKDTCSVKHMFEGDVVKTDETTILGADDKAGVVLMLYMIRNRVPGHYYFFSGEEAFCVGSEQLSKDASNLQSFHRCISLDAPGYSRVTTRQLNPHLHMYFDCCSNEFATALADRLNFIDPLFSFSADPDGLFTDSRCFTQFISECTNLSVGYFYLHTRKEEQNLAFLSRLADALIKMDWSSLPYVRQPVKDEW